MPQQIMPTINAEDLPTEEFNFVKAQQAIYDLCKAVSRDEKLKIQLASAKNPEDFLAIAADRGYEFTFSDLQVAIKLMLDNTEISSDESDDYELSEEDLEMVAGGTAAVRAASRNSYWHQTGILVNQQCFHLLEQSTSGRDRVEQALQSMELWVYKGNGRIQLFDLDGVEESYEISNVSYDGLALGGFQNTSDKKTYSSGNLTNLLL